VEHIVPSILILAEVSEPIVELCSGLTRKGYDCSISPVGEDIMVQQKVMIARFPLLEKI